jgi:signal transduction histidine kinase
MAGADDAALAVLGRDGSVVDLLQTADAIGTPGAGDPGRRELAAAEWWRRTRPSEAVGDSVLVPVLAQGTVVGSLHLVREPGRTPFTTDDLASIDTMANAAGFVIARARSSDRDELRRRWLEASAWLGEALRPPIDGQLALKRITEVARSISGASATAFLQWPTDGSPIVTVVEETVLDAGALIKRLQDDRMLSAPPQDVLQMLVDGRRAIVLPLRSQIAVPAALVACFDGDGDEPAAAEESGLLESLAGHASMALDRVQAAADRLDLEEASRRDRVARELHDGVLQRLFATGLQLEGIRHGIGDPVVRDRIDVAVEDIDLTIKHLREAIVEADRATAGPG